MRSVQINSEAILRAALMAQRRWREVAMASQSAMNSPNPVLRIEDQFYDLLRTHEVITKLQAQARRRDAAARRYLAGSHAQRFAQVFRRHVPAHRHSHLHARRAACRRARDQARPLTAPLRRMPASWLPGIKMHPFSDKATKACPRELEVGAVIIVSHRTWIATTRRSRGRSSAS